MADLSSHLSADAVNNIQKWLSEPKYVEYKSELEQMIESEDWNTLEDSFFKVVEFGTGGRRGTTGIGSNRINKVTMGESAQALCQYAISVDPAAAEKGVVIACDTRLTSKELSEYCAAVCAANGFRTYIFDSFRSTPELSFAVRHLGTAIGIVVSASHNPPADNGFKGYWSDGGQLVAPHDKGVLDIAASITTLKVDDFSSAVEDGRIQIVSSDIDTAYVEAVNAEACGVERSVNIVYSPLHGAGQTNVLPVLKRAGFNSISLVEHQMTPDGNFPTVKGHKANPEEPIANELAVEQMMEKQADIAITNDPDADRIGVMVRHDDRAIYLNGNQSAVLATDYALMKLQQKNELTPNHFIAKTIVTTEMLQAIADHYDVRLYGNMLVGFKYIGELIRLKESTDETFVIGGEESYGLLKGTYARDKDGATGALPLAEYAAELKKEGKTLYGRLLELFSRHGVYSERLDSVYFEGASGFKKMQSVMDALKTTIPKEINGIRVTAISDYRTSKHIDLETNAESVIDCPSGNVVALEFNNDSRCRVTIRPSGTEPKMKFYVQWYENATDNVEVQLTRLDESLQRLSKALERQLLESE